MSTDATNEQNTQTAKEAATAVFMNRVTGWIVPGLLGACLTLLFNVSGDRATLAATQAQLNKLEAEVHNIQTSLASGGPPALARRVDDLQNQSQEQLKEIKKELEQIRQLLIQRR